MPYVLENRDRKTIHILASWLVLQKRIMATLFPGAPRDPHELEIAGIIHGTLIMEWMWFTKERENAPPQSYQAIGASPICHQEDAVVLVDGKSYNF